MQSKVSFNAIICLPINYIVVLKTGNFIIIWSENIFFLPPILKTKLFFAHNLEHSAELDLSSQKMGCVSKGMVQFFARTRRRMKNTLICE